ncbi:sigma-54 interaction domain-containing protein [Rummeliibacillus pycnus]|uniref:sigma-54 interaction domain-containing protein n=1 Tax=Rummeliibacillus pycnus TaxID=101070 RepID=UPI003D26A0DE
MLFMSSITKMIKAFAELLQVEIAFFNSQGLLIASTEEYINQKKNRVYSPFFKKQFKENLSFVNDPGNMKMCKGCHFQSNCPSKAEILFKMTENEIHFGFLSFVSFSNEGQKKLIIQQDYYNYWLSLLSDLLISFIGNPKNLTVDFARDKDSIHYILGNNNQLNDLKELLSNVVNSSSSVVITGETGTGKSLLAKLIHEQSIFRKGKFVEINCASIPESLFESELFGYENGAFTGANKNGKAGYFELADRGTLFLDEIGDLPLHLQPKLLKILQDGMVQRLGGTHPQKVNVRIIAATNQSLEKLINEKKFRADLYYRLNVIPIHLPPLRERKDDLEILVPTLIERLQERTGKFIESCSESYLKRLSQYHWPGNIRELENVIEYSMNMEKTYQLTESALPFSFKNFEDSRLSTEIQSNSLKTLEKEGIINALKKYGFDFEGKKLVAEELGISMRTLYRKIEKYSIFIPSS